MREFQAKICLHTFNWHFAWCRCTVHLIYIPAPQIHRTLKQCLSFFCWTKMRWRVSPLYFFPECLFAHHPARFSSSYPASCTASLSSPPFPRCSMQTFQRPPVSLLFFFLLIFLTCSRCAVPQDPVGLWQEGAAWHLLSPMHEARPAAPAGCVGTLQPYNWLHAWSPLWLIKPFSSTPEEKNK